jgi:aryl-alcohol dehydrogenase-like predicted oxidoreductase
MGMSHAYGTSNEQENLSVLNCALEMGCNFWDTADFYSEGENEKLLSKALKGNREEVFLCTKVGNVFDRTLTSHQDQVQKQVDWIVDGSPDYINKCIDKSLQRLGVDHIDLYYLHRVDPLIPIEESIGAMADLVKRGKVRYLGLSEASVDTIRRAAAVHPITALQSEYSLWTRDIEDSVIPLCRELGITIVPFAPLGRGYLTGKITKKNDLAQDDWRRKFPRFQDDNIEKNKKIVKALEEISALYKVTPAQIALAWLLEQEEHLIPIPGTRHIKYLKENFSATQISLSEENLSILNAYKNEIAGERFPINMSKLVDR